MMGTDISIVILTTKKKLAEQAIRVAFAEMKRVEDLMTDWQDTSPLMAINRNAGLQPIKTPQEILTLLAEAQKISELTDGAFDVSYGAVGELWDFTKKTGTAPARAEITSKLPLVDYRKIKIDPKAGTAYLEQKGMRIGLGGIAKGYAVDRAVQVIKRFGFDNFAVSAGGDLTVRGRKDGKLWNVAIRDPRDKSRNIALLPVSNATVVTSGDDERYFEHQGKRYTHILDPRTGYPADKVQSVTILSQQASWADALATGIFVLGPKKGLKVIESLPNVEGMIVDKHGKIHASKGLQK